MAHTRDSEGSLEEGSGLPLDFLELVSAKRRATSPTFAASEARIQAAGGGWVVERPVEHENGEIEWVIVGEG